MYTYMQWIAIVVANEWESLVNHMISKLEKVWESQASSCTLGFLSRVYVSYISQVVWPLNFLWFFFQIRYFCWNIVIFLTFLHVLIVFWGLLWISAGNAHCDVAVRRSCIFIQAVGGRRRRRRRDKVFGLATKTRTLNHSNILCARYFSPVLSFGDIKC